jgi:hypothetical protein
LDNRKDFRILKELIAAMMLEILSTNPRNPANTRFTEYAEQFVQHGEQYSVDPVVLAVWSFYESSWDDRKVGNLGEVGLFQVHGVSRKICEAAKLDPIGIECGALLIDADTRFCGDLKRGLYRYASGKCKGTPAARRAVAFRLGEVKRWKKKKH